jgi:hypothetical protein
MFLCLLGKQFGMLGESNKDMEGTWDGEREVVNIVEECWVKSFVHCVVLIINSVRQFT